MTLLDFFFSVLVLVTLFTGLWYMSRLVATWRPSDSPSVPTVDRELIALLDRKAHLLEDLRDLELDYQMGKIPEDGYRSDMQRLEPEAVAVLKELEARGVGIQDDDLLEAADDIEDYDAL